VHHNLLFNSSLIADHTAREHTYERGDCRIDSIESVTATATIPRSLIPTKATGSLLVQLLFPTRVVRILSLNIVAHSTAVRSLHLAGIVLLLLLILLRVEALVLRAALGLVPASVSILLPAMVEVIATVIPIVIVVPMVALAWPALLRIVTLVLRVLFMTLP